jgi:isochorismate synthase
VSIFYYRTPGNAIVELQGDWSTTDSVVDSDFWISDFEAKRFYTFEKNKGNEKIFQNLSFRKQRPTLSTRQEYIDSANEIIHSLNNIPENKVIFSRIEAVAFNGKHSHKLFQSLCELYPDAFVYLISSPHFGTWTGASPEILITMQNTSAKTVALAGTKNKEDGSPWEKKEIAEQKTVSDFIESTLNSFSGMKDLHISDVEETIAGSSKHLKTEFNFTLDPKRYTDLLLSLHPTPAVAGFPVESSIASIDKYEKHKRQLYCGILSIEGNQSYVNLRCAQIQKEEIFIYVGGGFNILSIAEDEYEETNLKAKTIQNALIEIKGK